MFVEGGVPLDVPVESLAVISPVLLREPTKGGNVLPHKRVVRCERVLHLLKQSRFKRTSPEPGQLSIMA